MEIGLDIENVKFWFSPELITQDILENVLKERVHYLKFVNECC